MFESWTDSWHDEKGGWWRTLLVLAAYFAGLALGGLALIGLFNSVKRSLGGLPDWGKELVETGLIGAGFLCALVAFIAAKAMLHRGRPSVLHAPGMRLRIVLGFASAMLWLVLITGGEIVLGNGPAILERLTDLGAGPMLAIAGVSLFAFGVQSGSEEMVFRGYLLPRFSVWFGPVIAIFATTVLFTVVHFDPGIWGAASIFVFGLAMGISVVRLGTILPALGLHVANNAAMNVLMPTVDNSNLGTMDFIVYLVASVVWLAFVYFISHKAGSANAEKEQCLETARAAP